MDLQNHPINTDNKVGPHDLKRDPFNLVLVTSSILSRYKFEDIVSTIK